MIPIQATISGYGGKAATLYSAYAEDTGILVVSRESEFRRFRHRDCLLITNETSLERDSLFSTEDIADAIVAYYALLSGIATDDKSPRLVISDMAQRANPDPVIEKDGADTRGPKYRVSDGITCLQMAALATCWYAYRKAGAAGRVFEMMDTIYDAQVAIMEGRIVSI